MPLVPAICTQCGAQIEVDNTHEAGICKHCGTAFITEKAINKYTTYITNHNNFAGANINMNIVSELEQLVSAAEGFQRLGEFSKAIKTYETITEKYPQDPRGWIGCVSTIKEGDFFAETPMGWDAYFLEKEPFSRWYKNACMLADDSTKKYLKDAKATYIASINKKWLEFKKVCSLQGLKNYIGNDIYVCSHNRGYYRDWFYVLDDKLYYQCYMQNADGDGWYNIYEVTAIDSNMDMHVKSCFAHVRGEKVLKLFYFEKSKIVLDNGLMIFDKSQDVRDRESISIAWNDAQTHEKNWERSNTPTKSGCYIATCVYGSYDCPQVWTLRRFRDYTLDETWYGRVFIKCYYAISPTLVKWFGNQKWFKTFWKNQLDRMISNLNQKGIENTQYHDKY